MTKAQAPASLDDGVDELTDFNDLAQAVGPDAVRQCIDGAVRNASAARALPGYRVDKSGVWYIGVTHDGDPAEPQWVCSTLHVRAKTRDAQSEQWGRLLEWQDADTKHHEWAAPAAILVGDGRDFARELAAGGVEIAPGPKAMQRLIHYVMTQQSEARARCVSAPGWHGGVYVLPTGESLGQGDEAIVYQHSGGLSLHYGQAGDWRGRVAPLCVGNSRLLLAVAAMLSGPMLRASGIGGGGIHFVGTSSTGKSTLLKVAASVVGAPQYAREWRATANGLEGIAVLHNDATLILDEISQIDAQQAGEAVYMLANGTGKSRANRAGDSRAPAQWVTQTLSAGELGLGQHMGEAGKRVRAGQAVRLAEVPADAGAEHGVFDQINSGENGAAFSQVLREASAANFGTQWRPWLTYLAAHDVDLLADRVRRDRAEFKRSYLPPSSDGQVIRVAERFALAATAAELATGAGITGWPRGEAWRGVSECFLEFIAHRGGAGSADTKALLSQVRAFFEAHGESRFQDEDVRNERPVPNRAGFRRVRGGKVEYLVPNEAFGRELCVGFDSRRAGRDLRDAGWLKVAGDGRLNQRLRIAQLGLMRLYVFDAEAVHSCAI